MVPREVRDHINAIEKDWDDFQKKRAELDKELGRTAPTSDLAKNAKNVNGKLVAFTPIWVPIPIWTTSKKAPEYKTTDPEWNEFLKLEQDPERVKKLKGEVARIVATGVLDGLPPPVERAWGFDGKVSFDSGQIDFVFPFSPPNVYERPGLLVSPNGIRWSSQELPDERGRRFHRIFHPVVFALAFWAGGKAFAGFYYTSFKTKVSEMFGEKPKRVQTRSVSNPFKGISPEEQAQLKRAFTLTTSPTLMDPEDSAELLRVLVPPPALKSAMEAAVNAYKRKHTHLQVAKWKECPRGGCYLTGHVDIRGTKATIRVSVKAIYIPAQDTFLGSPTIGEAVVMPKLSMMTADKLKLEKIKDMEGSREEKLVTDEFENSRAKIAKLKKEVAAIVKEKARLQKENTETEKKAEIAETEGGERAGVGTTEDQKRLEVAMTESLKASDKANRKAVEEVEKANAQGQEDPKPKNDKLNIDAAEKDPGQGPPDKK